MDEGAIKKYGYLGPAGTFSEEAALRYYANRGYLGEMFSSIGQLIEAVAKGMVDEALAPHENSIEGIVTQCFDAILRSHALKVQEEVWVPIQQNLIGLPTATIDGIRCVLSHPQALAQCEGWLNQYLPRSAREETTSTAKAVEEVMRRGDLSNAAIGSRRAVEVCGAHILQSEIQGMGENRTKFFVLSYEEAPLTNAKCRTYVACSTAKDEPGSLNKVLRVLEEFGINMTNLQTRPARTVMGSSKMGEYVFLIEFEGDVRRLLAGSALRKIQQRTTYFRVLGSYSSRKL
ncbi:MAG TPA: prephenate dehydratase [Patescibacteria group bacterium]|nr:prephenate dehydratase [Patescibacteria group bacterium]